MEFTSPGEIGIPSSSPVYTNPSLIRGGSAFSKPILFSSSSLLPSPRAGGASVGEGGARNGSILSHSQQPPRATTTTPESASAALDPGKNTDQSSISNSPPCATAVGASSNSKAKSSTAPNLATANSSTNYKECLRNHAAATGGHVVDGCGEFMPSGDADTPDALKCAACGCHRSFHRREADGGFNPYFHGAASLPLLLPPPPLPQSQPQPQPQPNPHQHHHHRRHFQFGGLSCPPHGFVQFGGHNPSGSGGTTTESSSEEKMNSGAPAPAAMPRKRFRTKFTAEQKEKMLAFAERVEWRIQRQDSAMVEQFCAEIGVRRHVLKVWMHNNKHTINRKPQLQPPPATHHLL